MKHRARPAAQASTGVFQEDPLKHHARPVARASTGLLQDKPLTHRARLARLARTALQEHQLPLMRQIQYRAVLFALQARFQRKLVPRPVWTVPRASTMLMLSAQRATTTQMRTVPSVRLERTALQAHQVVWRAPQTQTRFRGAHLLWTVRVAPG